MSAINGQRALELALGDQRLALQGGWNEDGVLGLRVAVMNGDDITRFSVLLPIGTDGERLLVGTPTVREGWPE